MRDALRNGRYAAPGAPPRLRQCARAAGGRTHTRAASPLSVTSSGVAGMVRSPPIERWWCWSSRRSTSTSRVLDRPVPTSALLPCRPELPLAWNSVAPVALLPFNKGVGRGTRSPHRRTTGSRPEREPGRRRRGLPLRARRRSGAGGNTSRHRPGRGNPRSRVEPGRHARPRSCVRNCAATARGTGSRSESAGRRRAGCRRPPAACSAAGRPRSALSRPRRGDSARNARRAGRADRPAPRA